MTGQLQLLTDPLRNELEPAEVQAVEAAAADDRRVLFERTHRPQHCRCLKPWNFEPGRCLRCGREVAR